MSKTQWDESTRQKAIELLRAAATDNNNLEPDLLDVNRAAAEVHFLATLQGCLRAILAGCLVEMGKAGADAEHICKIATGTSDGAYARTLLEILK